MFETVDEIPVPIVDLSSFQIRNIKEADFEMIKGRLLKSKSQSEVDMLAFDVFLKQSMPFCFLAEFKSEPVAAIFASPHANDFYEHYANLYLPSMQNKTSPQISLHTEVKNQFLNFFGYFIYKRFLLQSFCSNLTLKKPSDLVLLEYPSKFIIETLDNQYNLNINFVFHQLFDILFLSLRSQGLMRLSYFCTAFLVILFFSKHVKLLNNGRKSGSQFQP
jgi:ABC-type long-subunit fatty acid transport system fused permease/ATPase subunit